jgi:hypothetical protein
MCIDHLLSRFAAQAQDQVTDEQIENWVKSLSVKRDLSNEKFGSVRKEVFSLDPEAICTVLDRIAALSLKGNIRCQIRTMFLYHNKVCPNSPSPLDNLRHALQLAYEIEDEFLQYDLHLSLGQHYNGAAQYGLANLHFRQYFDILARHKRSDLHLPSVPFPISVSASIILMNTGTVFRRG